jgi:hypothetical protein
MDRNYIADHIYRIETRFKDNPELQKDSMWRIASNANLIDGLIKLHSFTRRKATG